MTATAHAKKTPESLMPDNSVLTIELVEKAFRMIGSHGFSVSANLSVDDRDSLKNYGTFQSILLMAYNEGRASRGLAEITSAEDVLG